MGTIRPAGPGGEPRTIFLDITEAAQWMAQQLPLWGYRGDFSPDGLCDEDRLLDENIVDGRAKQGGRFAQHFGSYMFALGAF